MLIGSTGEVELDLRGRHAFGLASGPASAVNCAAHVAFTVDRGTRMPASRTYSHARPAHYRRTLDLATAALVTALIAASAWLTLPLGAVPVTLQVFFVVLAALLLPPGWAAASMLAYVVLGAAGLPVFSGAQGGSGRARGSDRRVPHRIRRRRDAWLRAAVGSGRSSDRLGCRRHRGRGRHRRGLRAAVRLSLHSSRISPSLRLSSPEWCRSSSAMP